MKKISFTILALTFMATVGLSDTYANKTTKALTGTQIANYSIATSLGGTSTFSVATLKFAGATGTAEWTSNVCDTIASTATLNWSGIGQGISDISTKEVTDNGSSISAQDTLLKS